MYCLQASAIKDLHLKRCPSVNPENIEVQLSSDGVSECRSNSVSLDVYSSRVHGCKQIYPLKIVRPLDTSFVDREDHLENVLCELKDCSIKVKHYIADNKKRATSKRCLNHASLFPCEYCFG